jgi:multiple sugar transport system permease protein
VNGFAALAGARRGVAPGLWFVAPALAAITVFFALPVVAGLLLSFTDFDIYALGDPSVLRFVGLENYRRLLGEPLFWKALGNTLVFCLVGGPLTVGLALAAALALRSPRVRGRAFFRTVFFLPAVTTLVAVAVVWRYLYHPRLGLLNQLLAAVGVGPVDWLGDPRFALPAIIGLAVWKNFGFDMVIFLAGLEAIPPSLYEAARIDGASRLAQLRHVTLPMLSPTLVFVAVVTAIGYLQLFAEPYVMTQGGPGDATTSVVLLLYEEGFRWWNLGQAAAIAFVLFAIIGAATALQLRAGREAA